MAFSFSFFSSPSSGTSSPESEEFAGIIGAKISDPRLWTQPQETAEQLQVSSLPPATGGLAAMAVQQSTSGPLAPPSRRINHGLTPGPAIAASLALAAQASAQSQPIPMEMPPSAPATHHYNAQQSLSNRDLAQLRLDLEAEIEQVRQDLFGAAMGVSALKDRIDGLEAMTAKEPATVPPLSPAEVERLVRDWLDAHLPSQVETAIQSTLDQALQQTISSLSSSEFFRMPVHTPGLNPDKLLSQAPQILSTSLS